MPLVEDSDGECLIRYAANYKIISRISLMVKLVISNHLLGVQFSYPGPLRF